MLDLSKYKKAFIQLTGAREPGLTMDYYDDYGASIQFEDKGYRVCRFNDLLREFKTFFDDDYDLICTETPFELWKKLFEQEPELSREDMIIDMYSAWKIYWDNKLEYFSGLEEYTKYRNIAEQNFYELVGKVKGSSENIFWEAISISDIDFIPIMALTLRLQNNSEEQFYLDCVHILIEDFPYHFGSDGSFDTVRLNGPNSTEEEIFYIFRVGY
jgi:hypothetical protein